MCQENVQSPCQVATNARIGLPGSNHFFHLLRQGSDACLQCLVTGFLPASQPAPILGKRDFRNYTFYTCPVIES